MTSRTPAAPRAPELLLATRNRGKTRELRDLLAPLGWRVVDLDDAGLPPTSDEDALEDAPTFEGNALAKARHFARLDAGRAVVADDSGLCVAALRGAPGVHSRRYAGALGADAEVTAANCAKLLRELADADHRDAEFVCAIAYVDADRELVTVGRARGRILDAPAGTCGFGYDPLFWSEDLGCTFGEATDAAKAGVSHRARAIAALGEALGDASDGNGGASAR